MPGSIVAETRAALLLGAVLLLGGCAAEGGRGLDAHQAGQGDARIRASGAGWPAEAGRVRDPAGGTPTDMELDHRERTLAGPRPRAGPPLRDGAPDLGVEGERPPAPTQPATDPKAR